MMLISAHTGSQIRSYAAIGQAVTISIDFDIPKSKNKVNVDLWINPSDIESYDFQIEFNKFYKNALFQHLNLNILAKFDSAKNHFISSDMEANAVVHKMTKSCYSKGKYCFLPHMPVEKPLEIIDEGLRQMCIANDWSDYRVKNFQVSGKALFFKYIEAYRYRCLLQRNSQEAPPSQVLYSRTFSENKLVPNQSSMNIYKKDFSVATCSRSIMEDLGINWDLVQECVENSFKANPDLIKNDEKDDKIERVAEPSELIKDHKENINKYLSENYYLNKAYESGTSYDNLYIVPSAVINKQMYAGNFDCLQVTQAICDGFEGDHSFCSEFKHDWDHKINSERLNLHQEHFIDFVMENMIVVMILLFLLILVIAVTLCTQVFNYNAKKNVGKMIDAQVVEYQKIKIAKESHNNSRVQMTQEDK